MQERIHVPDLGAPDPELDNSPIAGEMDEASETLYQEVPGEPICMFNNQAFNHGTYVRSGDMLLCCDYGIWLSVGSADPDNP